MTKAIWKACQLLVIICIILPFAICSCKDNTLEPSETDHSSLESTNDIDDILPPPPSSDIVYIPNTNLPSNLSEDDNLVPYDGDVEHIFFHEVIAYPQLAFDGDSDSQGYDDYMVTASEYLKILYSLYESNFILINMNDVWSEEIDANGRARMVKNTLMLPEGKLPIIISFDDLSFYEYMEDDGFMSKYIIGDDGDIWASGIDPDGNFVKSQDLAAITILDKFIREHPDFSLNGAKGCIAFTGYQGILGYRTQYDRNNDTADTQLFRMHEIARVQPIIEKLKETGWYFACHSYGHIDLSKSSYDTVKADADRWMDEVGSLVGETQIFLYPYGSRLDGNDVSNTGAAFRYYHQLGFRLYASVGYEPFSQIKSDISAVICDRMNVDGIAFATGGGNYTRFYNVAEIRDPLRPTR
ncbi:MAG: polysaccharide deacetylase family protein [Oscillospiraceae bacterium]|nr:polysaccharide deacetylase family protein [Oscillospiraceae bacterium]